MRPVCVECSVEMRCVKNEHTVETLDHVGESLTIASGDRYQCESCEVQVIVGCGRPLERHEDGFVATLEHAQASGHHTRVA